MPEESQVFFSYHWDGIVRMCPDDSWKFMTEEAVKEINDFIIAKLNDPKSVRKRKGV